MKGLLPPVLIASSILGMAIWLTWDLPNPPPNYRLQTDGVNWRFIGCEGGDCFTNENNDGTRSGCVKEALKIYNANHRLHGWKDHK